MSELGAAFAQAQVREVRRVAAHLRRLARRPQLIEQRGLPVPLLEERRVVFRLLAFTKRVAQPLEIVDERGLGWRRARRRGAERARHPLENGQLFRDDRHGE